MLLGFGAKNFCCFREGVDISMEFGPTCPKSISKEKPVTNLLCVKGANGSGKTNIIKIIAFLKHFCCHSFNNKPDEEIYISSFFSNNDPIELFCRFIINGVKYKYELCLDKDKVISEVITKTIKRESTIFKREGNKLTSCIKDFSGLKKIKLRKNASVISTANQYDNDQTQNIYKFFESITTNVCMIGKTGYDIDYNTVSELYKQNKDIFKKAINIISKSDLGVTNIHINKREDEEGTTFYYPVFTHDANDVKHSLLTYHFESTGTQLLFKTLPYYLETLKQGGILAIDEFDSDLHPHILPKITALFENEETNPNNAQMIFSTHDSSILDHMGKYRTVLVNKESSESYAYRLDEIPGEIIRNDRSLTSIYDSGKLGGVPKL
ncbi:MAG: ATP-binding protein [Deltaproteobacteria bacterium]|nr:ATP-binding protein [Deltaproteobacteria bacterium]